eukprot:6061547-Amphidinium_carterae.1
MSTCPTAPVRVQAEAPPADDVMASQNLPRLTRAGAPKRDPKSRVTSRQGLRRLEDGRLDGGVVEDEDEESEYDEPS